jgi:hypothetical protein
LAETAKRSKIGVDFKNDSLAEGISPSGLRAIIWVMGIYLKGWEYFLDGQRAP